MKTIFFFFFLWFFLENANFNRIKGDKFKIKDYLSSLQLSFKDAFYLIENSVKKEKQTKNKEKKKVFFLKKMVSMKIKRK